MHQASQPPSQPASKKQNATTISTADGYCQQQQNA